MWSVSRKVFNFLLTLGLIIIIIFIFIPPVGKIPGVKSKVNKQLIRRWDTRTWYRSILLPVLRLTPSMKGFLWDGLHKILRGGQRMTKAHNGEKYCWKLQPPEYGTRTLQTLHIRKRVKFKVACLVRQSLSGQAPLYLAEDCCLVSESAQRSLRSADIPTCVVPRTYSSYGDRTFAASGPHLWNSLPVQLRNPDISYGLFRRQLKGHL